MDAKLTAETANAIANLVAGVLALVAALSAARSRRRKKEQPLTLSDIMLTVSLALWLFGALSAFVSGVSYSTAGFFTAGAFAYGVYFVLDKEPISRRNIVSLVLQAFTACLLAATVSIAKMLGLLEALIDKLKK
jgi:hypothetical protein